MSTVRPFTYNTGDPIAGTTQLGDLAIGPPDDYTEGGVHWFNGAAEEFGYVICAPVPTQDFPTGDGANNGNVQFWRTDNFSDAEFINLVNTLYNQSFINIKDAKGYLTANGYWTSFIIIGKIAAENYNSTLLNNEGQLWSWGYNAYGKIGDNSTISKSTPVSILGSKKTFCSISSGGYNSIGIDYVGQIWGWGYNAYGQLGNNSTTNKSTPVSILGTKKTFCSIAAGNNHSIGIDYTGQIWGWGFNDVGQLGDNSVVSKRTPVSILGTKKTFCSIESNIRYSIGLDYTGQVWSWGYNIYGQLGDNSVVCKSTPVSILGTKKTFCSISTGSYHSLGIDITGQIWIWGYNVAGQLGINSTTSKSTPVSILGNKKTFCSISGGYYHSLGIDYTGQVWGWGYNNRGQLGNNSTTSKRTPVSILGAKKTFCSITAGYNSLGLDYKNQVWVWGSPLYGDLGINYSIDGNNSIPNPVYSHTFCITATGYFYSLGIDYTGQIWGWGYGAYGQLGNNSNSPKSTPVSILGTKKTFCSIEAGNGHSLGIDYTGQVWGWGYNYFGELGNNSVASKLTPVSILGNKKTFCLISTTFNHSLGIDYTGYIWTWGDNTYGQLGINSVTNKSTPVSILGTKKTFCKIIGAQKYTAGIDQNGQLWTWGNNLTGQLGINSIVEKSTPVSILGTKKTFCSINGGYEWILGIDYTGQAWGWGQNDAGQLGDNSVVCKSTPVSILGAKKTFCKIVGGNLHSLGIDYTGQAWGWGYNNKGQLGDNSVISKRTPVSILGTKKTFCSIAAGYNHSLGIDYNGQMWGWGYNAQGQLGIKTEFKTPMRISYI